MNLSLDLDTIIEAIEIIEYTYDYVEDMPIRRIKIDAENQKEENAYPEWDRESAVVF